MSAALDRCTAALGNPNVKAFLRVIRAGESSQDDSAYTIIYGGGHFSAPPWRHPYQGVPTTQGGKAAGAYQFLGTTWDRCASALGLGEDFSPASQDIGAVYLIDGRGALGAVENGDLSTAIVKLAQEWVSLPGLGARAAAVFQQYGGTQTGAGGAISSPDAPPYVAPAETAPAAPNQPQGDSMPILALLSTFGPLLAQLLPQVATVVGGQKDKQNLALAGTVLNTIVQATGAGTEANAGTVGTAIHLMQTDPAMQKKAVDAVVTHPDVQSFLQYTEVGGGVKAAGDRAIAMQQAGPWYRSPVVFVTIAILPLVYIVVVAVMFGPAMNAKLQFSEQIITVVVTAIAVGTITSICGFWLGGVVQQHRTSDAAAPVTPPAA